MIRQPLPTEERCRHAGGVLTRPPAPSAVAQADARMVRTRRRATPAHQTVEGAGSPALPSATRKVCRARPALHPRKTPRRNHAAQTPNQVVWPWGPAQGRIDPPSGGSTRLGRWSGPCVCVVVRVLLSVSLSDHHATLGHTEKSGAPSLGPLSAHQYPVSGARALTIFENCQDPQNRPAPPAPPPRLRSSLTLRGDRTHLGHLGPTENALAHALGVGAQRCSGVRARVWTRLANRTRRELAPCTTKLATLDHQG